MIIDSHAHYDDEKFNEDREELIASLTENGIEYVVNIGSSMAACHRTVELISKYDFFYGALGLHPCDVAEVSEEDFAWLRNEIATNPKVRAVGEIGLDYYWNDPEPAVQKPWFERQIELARELNKPIVVHSRDAAKDTYDMMAALKCGEIGGVVHCFSYAVEEAKKYLDMDFYIGVGGVITFKNGKKLKEVVEYAPLEKLLLETDCPYLAPEPYRGKRNSSLYIPHIVTEIAAIKGVTEEEVIRVTNENAKKMYNI